jgi:ketosteroid isomerase-like protein
VSDNPETSVSRDLVLALYRAYAAGDAQVMERLLHADVVWEAPAGNATQVGLGLGMPGDAGPPRGTNHLDRNAIVTFMSLNFPLFFRDADIQWHTLISEGNQVVAEHRLSATLPNGRSYLNDYCFVFEIRDGAIWRIREYMDTRGGWRQVFADDQPAPLMDYVES